MGYSAKCWCWITFLYSGQGSQISDPDGHQSAPSSPSTSPCTLDRFTKELFLNFGGSRLFLMEDFIALPVPKIFFVQMLPLPLVLALVFFTRVGSSWRRQKTTCGSIVCHYMNVSHLFCTYNIMITPTHPLSALQAPLIPLGYLW